MPHQSAAGFDDAGVSIMKRPPGPLLMHVAVSAPADLKRGDADKKQNQQAEVASLRVRCHPAELE